MSIPPWKDPVTLVKVTKWNHELAAKVAADTKRLLARNKPMTEPDSNGVIKNVPGCLPCPFCGGTEIHIQVFYEGVDHAIACYSCGAGWSMGNFNSNDEAIAAWNRRTT